MFLKKITLKNFRNYDDCRLEFPTKKTILVGKNAQGKSNMLEAVYYSATLSSDRASTDGELILRNHDFAVIKTEILKHDSDITLDITINPPKQKILKVNGLKRSKYAEFMGNLSAVNFGVSDLAIIRGTPSDRRKWLDNAIGQIYPAYKDRLSKYNKIRTQRNNLLKDLKGNVYHGKDDLLSVWDEQLVVSGSNIIHLRQKYIKEILERAAKKHNQISFGEEILSLSYESTVSGSFNGETSAVLPPEVIAEYFTIELAKKNREEVIRAQTLVGPHRDDISFFINDIDAKSYASQGQQRTIVLALKLAELDFINYVTGEDPILLLDDVLAELDGTRQTFLLESIGENVQTIITTTDVANFNPLYLDGVTVYNVSAGKISKTDKIN